MEQATTIPLDEECALSIKVGRDGVWLNFIASNGLQASLNMNAISEKQGHIIGSAIYNWCVDREKQAEQIKSDNSQFGVGA